uniref:NAC domain-containing protein n=1 Tax=Oryza meridionalis TaxID=40149 RepID=A0A0E0C2C3_9ORYZ
MKRASSSSSSSSGSMRLDEWVLCRIYKKKEANQQLQHYMNMMDDEHDDLQVQQAQSHRMSRPPSISDYLLDYSSDLPPSTDQTPSLHLGFRAVNEQGCNNNKRHKTIDEYYSISTAEMSTMLHICVLHIQQQVDANQLLLHI